MTPKDKAIELVKKFMSVEQTKLSDYSTIYQPTAKQCALIAVDEILGFLSYQSHIKYWQEVKQEIENL